MGTKLVRHEALIDVLFSSLMSPPSPEATQSSPIVHLCGPLPDLILATSPLCPPRSALLGAPQPATTRSWAGICQDWGTRL